MNQRIGACSICGGDVMGHVGPWMGVIPPPPPTCSNCGAVSAAHDKVIPMRPTKRFVQEYDLLLPYDPSGSIHRLRRAGLKRMWPGL